MTLSLTKAARSVQERESVYVSLEWFKRFERCVTLDQAPGYDVMSTSVPVTSSSIFGTCPRSSHILTVYETARHVVRVYTETRRFV